MEKVYLEIDDIIGKMGIDLNIIATPKKSSNKEKKSILPNFKKIKHDAQKKEMTQMKVHAPKSKDEIKAQPNSVMRDTHYK